VIPGALVPRCKSKLQRERCAREVQFRMDDGQGADPGGGVGDKELELPLSHDACPLSFQLCAKLLDFSSKVITRDFSADGQIGAAQPIP
jgi:hypothetical protein